MMSPPYISSNNSHLNNSLYINVEDIRVIDGDTHCEAIRSPALQEIL